MYTQLNSLVITLEEKQEIPKEIDDHLKLFGKEPWEIEYGDKCPLCNSRFDEFEGCACDSHRV